MPMNNRLLRPRQTIHPEAADWANRVRTNGGSVSGTTLTAVDKFVKACYANSIRDRFYRLNLFCGTGLNACLVPLYRGASFGGATYGNATDTNNNFVSGDYAETGASGGLKGNGSNKFLATGVNASLFSAADSHLSAGLVTAETGSGYKSLMGANTAVAATFELYARRDAGFGNAAAAFGAASTESNRFGNNVVTATLAVGHIIAAWPTMYRNGVASGATATTSAAVAAPGIHVFAQNGNGNASGWTNASLSSYSIGLGLTASQAAAFSTAHAAFNTAMSRT